MTILVAAAALVGGTASALARPAAPPAGRVSATLDACHPAGDLAGRYATFAAQMSAVAGTEQMSIRFELDQRTPAAPDFHPVGGVPGFGVWKGSAPGIDIFGFSQEVSSLSAPAAFRVTVSFRWLGPHHRVIKRARRMTPACSLPAPTAALVVGSLSRLTVAPPQASLLVAGQCPADRTPAPPAPADCR